MVHNLLERRLPQDHGAEASSKMSSCVERGGSEKRLRGSGRGSAASAARSAAEIFSIRSHITMAPAAATFRDDGRPRATGIDT